MKEKIYVYAIYTGIRSYVNGAEDCGDTMGFAVDKDLNKVASHYSSGINWTKFDMGINSTNKHDVYKKAFPNGYELIWLGGFNTEVDAMMKIKRHQLLEGIWN